MSRANDDRDAYLSCDRCGYDRVWRDITYLTDKTGAGRRYKYCASCIAVMKIQDAAEEARSHARALRAANKRARQERWQRHRPSAPDVATRLLVIAILLMISAAIIKTLWVKAGHPDPAAVRIDRAAERAAKEGNAR